MNMERTKLRANLNFGVRDHPHCLFFSSIGQAFDFRSLASMYYHTVVLCYCSVLPNRLRICVIQLYNCLFRNHRRSSWDATQELSI